MNTIFIYYITNITNYEYQFLNLSISKIINEELIIFTTIELNENILKDVKIIQTQLYLIDVIIKLLNDGYNVVYLTPRSYIINLYKFRSILFSNELYIYDIDDYDIMFIPQCIKINLEMFANTNNFSSILKLLKYQIINKVYKYGIIKYFNDGDIYLQDNKVIDYNKVNKSKICYSKSAPFEMIIESDYCKNEINKLIENNNYIFYPYLDVYFEELKSLNNNCINTLFIHKNFNSYDQIINRYAIPNKGIYINKKISEKKIPKILYQIWLKPIEELPTYIDYSILDSSWQYKLITCECFDKNILGRWINLFNNEYNIENKELILIFALLDSGGFVVNINRKLIKNIPDYFVNNIFLTSYENEEYSTKLSYDFLGSITNSSTINNIFNNYCSNDNIDKIIKTDSNTVIYPSYFFNKNYIFNNHTIINKIEIKFNPNINKNLIGNIIEQKDNKINKKITNKIVNNKYTIRYNIDE